MDKPGISFTDLVAWMGGPGAMMAVFAWLIVKGIIVTAREMRQREALKDRIIEIQAKQIADKERELAAERLETVLWRGHAFENMKLLGQSTELARTAVKKIPSKAKGDDAEGKDEKPC